MTKSQLETDIFNYKTPEFYINMKSIPDKKSVERKDFVLEEKRKCIEGININGIYIPGGLYFHLNYYHLQGDNLKTGKKDIFLPRLRDNEWIFFNDYDEAYKKRLIYTFFGLRQAGKSEMEASLCLRELSLFKETEAIALFSRTPDKDTFVKKITTAITHGEKFMIIPNIDKDWSKEEIRFGITRIDNTTDLRARLFIYNTQEGKKIQIGSGKALKHGSKVYYEDKIGNIEDCKVGDKIYGRDGNLTTILGVYPQGIVDLYEIELFDGRKITCSGDHLWTIENIEPHKDRVQTVNTEFLYNNFKRKYFNKKLNKEISVNRYVIPNINPVNYPIKNVLIDPYYLGLWLGDGTTLNQGSITTIEPEIVKFLEEYSEKIGGRLLQKENITYRIQNKEDFKHSPIEKLFKPYNLKGNKHIPKEYLYNSVDVRLELLKGLMDTDGYVDKNGKITIGLSNKILAYDVIQLIRSLGINCTVSEKETFYFSKKYNKKINGKISYTIYIGSCDLELFKLPKKLSRQVFKKRPNIGIENIKKVSPDYATCIAVDNKDSLFLTNDFIPTHNTPSFMLMDEIAISPFRGVYDVLEPALLSDSGSLRCSPLFTFTGGEVEKSKDAENLVKNPTNKQFTTQLENGTIVGGRFMSGLFRKDCKVEKKFSEYIGKKTNSWLDNMPIFVSDFNKANQIIEAEIEEAKKATDKNTLTLKRIFFPRNLDDVFLTESNNKFPVTTIKAHQQWLKEHYEPMYVDLYRDIDGKVKWKNSDRKPINKFPVKPKDDKLAPLCIYELPVKDAPNFTYVIGGDPINNDDSSDKEVSLFTLCVYKRMISPLDKFKNQVVASIAYRPNELRETHEMALMLCEFYNAVEGFLPEGSEASLIQYFYLKRKGHYLAQSFNLQTEVIAKKNIKGAKKVSLPATTINQKHYMNLLVEEANKEEIELDEEGNEIYTLGVTKEHDIMLLEEYANYKSKVTGRGIHDGNYDRIIARGCAETLARYYDIVYPIAQQISIKQTRPQEVTYRAKSTFWGSVELKPKSTLFDDIDKKPTTKLPSWMRGK